MDPVQFYETTIHNRDGGRAFSFVSVPRRSLANRVLQDVDAADVAGVLGLREPRYGDAGAINVRPVEAWSLPFLIDATLGRFEPFDLDEPFLSERFALRGLPRRGPSPFAQYLVYSPVVPIESSPLGGKALSDLATAGSGIGGALGAYATGEPLLLLTIPGGIVLCAAARGISDALRIGLRARLLDLMGVEDPESNGPSPGDDIPK